ECVLEVLVAQHELVEEEGRDLRFCQCPVPPADGQVLGQGRLQPRDEVLNLPSRAPTAHVFANLPRQVESPFLDHPPQVARGKPPADLPRLVRDVMPWRGGSAAGTGRASVGAGGLAGSGRAAAARPLFSPPGDSFVTAAVVLSGGTISGL